MENSLDIEANVHLRMNAQEVEQEMRRVASLARQIGATSGPGEEASAISRALLQLQAENEKLNKVALADPTLDRTAIKAEFQANNRRIRATMNAMLEGASQQVTEQVRSTAGSPSIRRATLKAEAQQPVRDFQDKNKNLSPAVVEARVANREVGASAKAETVRLREGGKDPEFVKTLVDLDTESRMFHTTMELARTATEDYRQAMLFLTEAQDLSAAQLAKDRAADQASLTATTQLTAAKEVLADTLILHAAGERAEGLDRTQLGDRAAELRRAKGLDTGIRRTRAIGDEEVGKRADLRAANTAVNAATTREVMQIEGHVQDLVSMRMSAKEVTRATLIQAARMTEAQVTAAGGPENAAILAAHQLALEKDTVVQTQMTAEMQAQAASNNTARATNTNAVTSMTAKQKAIDEAYLATTVQATADKAALSTALKLTAAGETVGDKTPIQAADRAAELGRLEGLNDTTRRAQAVGEEEIAARGEAVAATTAVAAASKKHAMETDGYVGDLVSQRLSSRAVTEATLIQRAGLTEQQVADLGGREAAAVRAGQLLVIEKDTIAQTTMTAEMRSASARVIAAKAVNADATKAEANALKLEAIKSGEMGGGFARTRAIWSGGRRTPADFSPGLGDVKNKIATSLEYGVGGVVTGALFAGVFKTAQEASKLEQTFVRMQGQLTALGHPEGLDEFRTQIKDISEDTGIAATDVAEFSSRMLGVFSEEGTAYALQQTTDAMKLMVVTGIDMRTMLQSVIPIAKSFNVPVAEIGSTAVEVGEMLGISEEQVVEFLGKAATVANETGLSMRELTTIGATMSQAIGKDLASSADVFNKMPALVRANQAKIFAVLRTSDKAAAFIDPMQEALKAGKPGDAFIELLKARAIKPEEGGLSEPAAAQLPELVGNRKEVEEVTRALAAAPEILKRLGDAGFLAEGGTKALEDRFQTLQGTVGQAIARIQRSLESFGEALYDAGISDVITQIGAAAEFTFGILRKFAEVIGTINEATKSLGFGPGIVGPLADIAVGAYAATKAMSLFHRVQDRLTGAKAEDTAATTGSTEATTRDTAASGEAAAAKTREAEARSLDAAAARRSYVDPSSVLGKSRVVPAYQQATGAVGAGLPPMLAAGPARTLASQRALEQLNAQRMEGLITGIAGGPSSSIATQRGMERLAGMNIQRARPFLPGVVGTGDASSIALRKLQTGLAADVAQFQTAQRSFIKNISTAAASNYTAPGNLFRRRLTEAERAGTFVPGFPGMRDARRVSREAQRIRIQPGGEASWETGYLTQSAAYRRGQVGGLSPAQQAKALEAEQAASAAAATAQAARAAERTRQLTMQAMYPTLAADELRQLAVANNQYMRSKSAMYQLGQMGSTPEQASRMSRAFSGGGTSRFNPLANATKGADYAVERAGGTPGIAGAGLMVPAIGITIAGALAVKSVYDDQKEEVTKASDDLREQMKTANKDKLQQVVDQGHSFWDTTASAIFGTDLPDVIAQQSITFQDAGVGRANFKGLIKANVVDKFTQRIGEQKENLDALSEFFNRNASNKELAGKLGLSGDLYKGQLSQDGTFVKGELAQANVTPREDTSWLEGGLAQRDKSLRTDFKVTADKLPAIVEEARKAIDKSDNETASQLLKLLGEDFLNRPGNEDLKAFASSGKVLNEVERRAKEAGGAANLVAGSFEEIRKKFQSGKLTLGEYINKAQAARDTGFQDAEALVGEDKIQADEKIAEMDSILAGARDDAVKARLDILLSINKRSGSRTPERDISRLTLANLPKYSHKEQLNQVPGMLDQLEKSFEEELEAIADPVERARRRAGGFEIPPELRALIVESQLESDTALQGSLAALEPILDQNAISLGQKIGEAVVASNKSAMDTVLEMLNTARDKAVAEAQAATAAAGLGVAENPMNEDIAKIDDASVKAMFDIGGEQLTQVIGGAAGFFNQTNTEFAKSILAESRKTGETATQVLQRWLKARKDLALTEALADGAIDAAEQANLDLLDGLIAASTAKSYATDTSTGNAETTAASERKKFTDIAAKDKTAIQSQAIAVRGDDVAKAQADLDQAWIDYGVELKMEQAGFPDHQAKRDAWKNVLERTAALEDSRAQVVLARLDWAEIYANGDPEQVTAARIAKAQQVLADALRTTGGNENSEAVIRARQDLAKLDLESNENQLNIVKSRFSVSSALASRDPVESARIALEQAKFETQNAKGTADANEKLAAEIRADHAYQDSLSQAIESRASLAQAIATANGDAVLALTIARDEAQRKLDEAVAMGVQGDALNPYTQRVVEANDALSKGALNRQQQIIDFQLAMGQITTEAAIASLQLLLSQTKEGTDEYMSLAQKIRQMEQSAGADLQFNLPTQLGLPTLYESRRLSQGTQAGIGYQDNRTVTVAINVNGAQDPAATAQQVMAAIQTASGSANVYSGSYMGVG